MSLILQYVKLWLFPYCTYIPHCTLWLMNLSIKKTSDICLLCRNEHRASIYGLPFWRPVLENVQQQGGGEQNNRQLFVFSVSGGSEVWSYSLQTPWSPGRHTDTRPIHGSALGGVVPHTGSMWYNIILDLSNTKQTTKSAKKETVVEGSNLNSCLQELLAGKEPYSEQTLTRIYIYIYNVPLIVWKCVFVSY